MEPSTEARESLDADPEVPDLDSFTSYEDGEYLVVCDRENPGAWIRADDVRDLDA